MCSGCRRYILNYTYGGNPIALDYELLKGRLAVLGVPIEMIFDAGSEENPFASMLLEFAEALAGYCAGYVTLTRSRVANAPGKPSLTLSCEGAANIHYLALPEGREAAVFEETLIGLAGTRGKAGVVSSGGPDEVKTRAEIFVFMATECPNCPLAVRAANRIAMTNTLVHTSVIDAQRYPRLAERYGVRSVPTTVIDRGFSTVGVVTEDDIAGWLLSRSGDSFRRDVFRSMIEAGRFDDAANEITQYGAARLFLPEWKHSTTSSRMGLMLLSETMLDKDRGALDSIVTGLLSALDSEDGALRGDTADLLGKIGHPSAREKLETLLGDPNPDVADIAADALLEIENRRG